MVHPALYFDLGSIFSSASDAPTAPVDAPQDTQKDALLTEWSHDHGSDIDGAQSDASPAVTASRTEDIQCADDHPPRGMQRICR